MIDRNATEGSPSDRTEPDRAVPIPGAQLPFGPSGHPDRWKVLGVLVIAVLIVSVDFSVLNLALPTIQRDLGASQSQLVWSVDAYSLALASLLISWGILADRFGRKRVLITGLTLFGIGSALSAFATGPDQLIAARAVMGIGGAGMMPITLGIITVVFPPAERGKAIGVWAGAFAGSMMLGPLLSGLLLQNPGWFHWLVGNDWGSIFLINVPVVAIAVFGIGAVVPETRNPNPHRLDLVGVVLSFAGLLLVVYGIIHAADVRTWLTASVLVPIAAGLVVLAGFGLYEARSPNPSFDVTLLRRRIFSVTLISATLTYFATGGLVFAMPFYIQIVHGFSPLSAGFTFLPVAIAVVLVAPASAALVARFGERAVICAGLLITTLAFAATARFGASTPMWLVLVVFFLYGIGSGNIHAPASTVMQNCLPPERIGAGAAIQATAPEVGSLLGVAVVGTALFTRYADALAPRLTALPSAPPPAARSALSDSISNLPTVLAGARRGGTPASAVDQLRSGAVSAFMHAQQQVLWITVAAALIGAVLIATLLPRRIMPAPRPEPVPGAEPLASTEPVA